MSTETALIIGGSSGIGLEIARQLAKTGHHVALLGSSAATLEAAEAELGTLAGARKVDLMNFAAVQALTGELKADSRHFSKLVNAAGVFPQADFGA